MQENKIVKNDILDFKKYLINMERSARTIDKYCRDVGAFIQYLAPGKLVTREIVIGYKSYLQGAYKISSANSMLAALNCFFHYKNWDRYRVSQFKVQRHLMGGEERRLTKEEYARLVTTALHMVILLNMYLSSTCIFTCHCLLIRLNWSICSFMHSTALASDWSMMHCSISIWHWIRISCSFL